MVGLVRDHGLEYLFAASLLTGVFQIVIGLLKLGRYIRFVSRSVMTGFVNSLAILIFLAQMPELIGANWQTFALVGEVRAFWDGPLVLGGAISTGHAVRAAEILGADFAYLGTSLIACAESMAVPGYKDMVVAAGAEDIVPSKGITVTGAGVMWPTPDDPLAEALSHSYHRPVWVTIAP